MKTPDPMVVVVDDDSSVRTALARLFKSAGMLFQTFASAEEFLNSQQIDSAACLIIDVQMPGMLGTELQQICANWRPALPIVIISAFNDPNAETRAIAAGAKAFLRKPFDAAELVDLVKKLTA